MNRERKNEDLVVGGGNGSPTVLESLLRTGYIKSLYALTTAVDNGGASGRRRINAFGNEIAYSDALRQMLALIDPEQYDHPAVQVVRRWFLHRDVRDNVLGHDIANHFFQKDEPFSQLESDLCDLGIRLMGTVIPSTSEPSQIVFSTASTAIYRGENKLDEHRTTPDEVREMWLDPGVPGYPPAIKAITDAKIIYLACGSMRGSVLCNFLPYGMKEAMERTKANIYLITNLMSTRNENHDATPKKLVEMVAKYIGRNVHGLVIPEMSRRQFEATYGDIASVYAMRESAFFLGWENDALYEAQSEGIQIITHNAVKIIDIPSENTRILRHDPYELAKTFQKLLATS